MKLNSDTLRTFILSVYPDFEWTVPPKPNLGVLTTNQAFLEAKKQPGSNPRTIAMAFKAELTEAITESSFAGLLSVAALGPYINIYVTDRGWQVWLDDVVGQPKSLLSVQKSPKKVLLDYVSPNVAKPLHVGHVRNIDIGEALRRLLLLKYPSLITDNHWGDWGIQFGIIIWAWKQFQQLGTITVTVNDEVSTVSVSDYDRDPIDTLVKIYVWGNQRKESVKNWDILVREEFIKLEQNDPENKAIWADMVAVSKDNIYQDAALLGLKRHDIEQGESFYEHDMKVLSEFFEGHNVWKKEGLARYIDLNELQEKWPTISPVLAQSINHFGRCYLISSQGYTTYPFRDVAARWQWARDIKADIMITLTGNEQKHNFDQAFSIVSYLASIPEFRAINTPETIAKLEWNNLVHIGYGFLKLPEGKMSTRKGNFVTAKDLINQIVEYAKTVLLAKNPDLGKQEISKRSFTIAIAALKWYDLARDAQNDIVLDIPTVLAFEGNTGVYQLYTYARLQTIITKNPEVSASSIEWAKLNEIEQAILHRVFNVGVVLEHSIDAFRPHILCNYLYELATAINSWYGKHSVTNEEDVERKESLVALCALLSDHLASCLDLLAINTLKTL